MNKWYKSAPCKGVLLFLEHLFAAVASVCFVWLVTCYMAGRLTAILDKPEKEYADSKMFAEQLISPLLIVCEVFSATRQEGINFFYIFICLYF